MGGIWTFIALIQLKVRCWWQSVTYLLKDERASDNFKTDLIGGVTCLTGNYKKSQSHPIRESL